MKVFWAGSKKSQDITQIVESIEWEGSDTQASRQASISVAYNPYRGISHEIKLGDRLCLKEDTCLFYGIVTSAERTGDIGAVKYTAKDYMHYLLRSTGSYNFKKTTPEKITKRICNDLQIETVSLYKTNIHLGSLLFENTSYYKMIVESYNHAARKRDKKNPKAFMPVMERDKLSVILKGESSGVILESNKNITKSSYSQTTDNMVDRVKIVDSAGQQVGQVGNEKNIKDSAI